MTPSATPRSPATPAPSSPTEPSTQAPAASSDAQAHALLSDSTKSWTRRAQEQIDLSKLTPQSQATLSLIASRISDGYKATELTPLLGKTASWVSEQLTALKLEVFAQIGLLRDLEPDELHALHESIVANGVQVPILLAEVEGRAVLIDGYNRLKIADAENIPPDQIPAIFLGQLDRDTARSIAFTVNAARRHLTRADRSALIDAELMRDVDTGNARSDRAIASVCGVNHETVGAHRARLYQHLQIQAEETQLEENPLAEIASPQKLYPDKRTGKDGRATKAPAAPSKPAAPAQDPVTIRCPTCNGKGWVHA